MRSVTLFFIIISIFIGGCAEVSKVGPQGHFQRGNQLASESQCQEAIAEYQQAIALDNTNAAFFYNMGLCYYQLSLWNQAIDSYHQAIKLQPRLGAAWYNLSLVYNKVDNTEQAFLAYERYQKIMQAESVPRAKRTPNQAQPKEKPKPEVLFGPNLKTK